MNLQELLQKNNLPQVQNVVTRPLWGYFKTEDNPKIALPDESSILALDECFDALDNESVSLRQAILFLNSKGYDISLKGLQNIWVKCRPDSLVHKKRETQKRRIVRKKARNAKTDLDKTLNKEERKLLKQNRKIANEKKKITFAQKRIAAMSEGVQKLEQEIVETVKIKSDPIVFSNPEVVEKIEESERPSIFRWLKYPEWSPQAEFLSSSELEVLYGGAAGGGKSIAMLADPMRYFHNKNFVGILFRRTNDELRELIQKSKEMYPQIVFKGYSTRAVFKEKQSEWQFPSGARFWITYLDRDDDVYRYHGQAFTWIGFDELTQWPTRFPWDYLRSRLRTADPELKQCLSMRASTNPGGPGHGWVKRMFIDPAPAGEAFWATNTDTGETLIHPTTKKPLFQRKFIPAKLKDNPYLFDDGVYETNLLSLTEGQQRQLLDGDWSVADGAAFSEFRSNIHVTKPFDIPPNWKKFRSADYGYASHSCVLWFAINPSTEQLVVYRELYVHKRTGKELARMVMDLEREEHVSYGVLDSSVWHKRGEGPSIAEEMINLGCKWRPSDRSAGSRVAGKDRLHELLKVDDNGYPGIVFFNTCRQIVNDLPVIPTSPDGSDDIDDRYVNDHSYDALRYGIMSRPKSSYWEFTNTYSTPAANVADKVFGY